MDTSDIDYPANPTTPGTIAIGTTDYGVISSVGDVDWFKVSLVAGQQYRFTIEAGTVNGLFDPQLAVYSGTGTLVVQATTGQGFQTKYVDFTPTTAGNYFLSASGGSLVGSYSLKAAGSSTGGPVTIPGTAANDTLVGTAANDSIDGGAGTDTVRYTGASSTFSISRDSTGAYTVRDNTGAQGTDLLANVERLQFADKKLALDLAATGSAGKTAEVICAAFGKATLANKQYVGIGLNLFDGGNTMAQVAQLCLSTGAVSAPDNTSFVKAVWLNVMGSAIDTGNLGYYVGLLENRSFTQATLLALAAETPANQVKADLVGLAGTGLEYI